MTGVQTCALPISATPTLAQEPAGDSVRACTGCHGVTEPGRVARAPTLASMRRADVGQAEAGVLAALKRPHQTLADMLLRDSDVRAIALYIQGLPAAK